MIFYCPACWHEMPSQKVVCPRCGTNAQQFFDEATFVQKPLRAVLHPEPFTARRAIWILGQKRCGEAVPVLDRMAQRSPDMYTLLAIVDALEKIGNDPARRRLERLSARESAIVAREAVEALTEDE